MRTLWAAVSRNQQISGCVIFEEHEENTQAKFLDPHHRPIAVAARSPTANTVPDNVSSYDLPEHRITARPCEPFSRPPLNEIVDDTAGRLHHSLPVMSTTSASCFLDHFHATSTSLRSSAMSASARVLSNNGHGVQRSVGFPNAKTRSFAQ
jgi:hypothetical protein